MKVLLKAKAVAILTAFLMVFAMMPLVAFGEETPEGTRGSHIHDNVTFEPWEKTDELPDAPGKYYLTADVTLSGTWEVPSGTTSLCLNGYGIKLAADTGSVIYVGSGNELNLYDCNSTDLTHQYTVSQRIATVDDTVTGDGSFSGGYITGGKGRDLNGSTRGGGILNDGTLNMLGGTIIGNTANQAGGLNNRGTFNMSGNALIEYNKADQVGGLNNAYTIDNSSRVTMSGNAAVVHNSMPFNEDGAGVSNRGEFFVSGSPVISENTGNRGISDFYVDRMDNEYYPLKVAGELTEDASIGVKIGSGDGKGIFAVPGGSYTITDNDKSRFFSDSNDLEVNLIAGKLELKEKEYDLWVGGTQVTSANCNDIPSDNGSHGGKASYDPDTQTLTLDNYSYTGDGYTTSGIFISETLGAGLTIVLKGNNTIKMEANTNTAVVCAGVSSANNLVIKDDPSDDSIGTLTAESINANPSTNSYGIVVYLPDHNLTIEGAEVTAIGHNARLISSGVYVYDNGDFEITGGSLTAIADEGTETPESWGIFVEEGEFTIGQDIDNVISSGRTGAIYGRVLNEIYGKGWMNMSGEGEGEAINISDTAKDLAKQYKYVKFKKILTITAKDQTYTYNGQTQGEGDPVYDDPAEIAEKVTVEGLRGTDRLASVVLNGAAKEVGEYPIEVSNAVIKNGEKDVTDEYDIIYVSGKLTIKEGKPEPKPEPTPTAKVSGTPLTKMAAGKTSITVAWEKVAGADGYDIFFARCDGKGKTTAKSVKSIAGNSTFTWKKSGLKKGTPYKAYVKAYIMKDGSKQYVKTSPLMHAYTGGGTKNYTNAKSVKVNKTKVSVKTGKTFQLKAKVKKLKKGKKLMPKKHELTVRYLSTDTSIATVSKKGKIKGVKAGTCYVYAYAHNGVFKKITVTVK